MSSLLSLSQQPWKRVASVAEGASVFLDDAAAEIFHWSEGEGSDNGGLLKLSLGIYSLYTDLNPIAKDIIAQAPYCNVVIVCTRPLIGRCAERIASLLSDIQPLECHVYCSVSESMHEEYTPMRGGGNTNEVGGDQGTGYSHYGEFQALMKKWIKRESGVRVSVSYIDLFHIEILSNLFCTPVYHNSLFSLTPSDIPLLQDCIDEFDPDISLETLNDLQFNWLPDSYKKTVKSFVQSFNSFLGSMDLQEDLFSVGPTSGLIADQLCLSEDARLRRKTASRKCSVLFLDRSLDLATPCSHSSEYLADRIFSQLPSNTNSNDVAISMTPLSHVDPRCIVYGCLAHPGCLKARSVLNSLTFSKQKEALMELSRNLLEALSKEKISARPAGRMGKLSPVQVKTFLEHFKNNPKTIMKHQQLLQMACGVVEVMEQNKSKEWEQQCKHEQMIIQNLAIGDSAPTSVVKLIMSIIDSQLNGSATERRVELIDIFCLIAEFYSLVGEECYNHITEEDILKESLINLMMMKREIDYEFLCGIGIMRDWSRLQIKSAIDSIFDTFNSLGTIRDNLSQYKDIHTPDADSYISPLLIQLLESICDSSRPDLPCVRHHSHGLSNIIRSSFSLFMSSARPRPDNHPLLIIFLVGGISVAEIRAVKEFITINKPNFEVYLGGNKLLTPRGVTKDLLTKETLLKQ